MRNTYRLDAPLRAFLFSSTLILLHSPLRRRRFGFTLRRGRGFLPPKMTRQADGGNLVALLQQLRAMQCRFCDQRVIIIDAKYSRARQRPDDEGNRLQLRARLRDVVLVHAERLHVEVVCEIFEAALVCDLGRE